MPLRRLPIAVRDKVAAELQEMEANGIIAPVTEPSSWVSALLVVAEPDGRIRICIDPKPLNKALKRAQYCMPTIDDVLSKIAGAQVFSIAGVRSGFWNLKLDDESSRLSLCTLCSYDLGMLFTRLLASNVHLHTQQHKQRFALS